MYIVVIGLGEVGKHLLGVLDKDGHDVVAVDMDRQAVQFAEDHYDVRALAGYGASQEVLEQAGVAKSDIVVAVSDHDEVNLIATLAAKQLGAKRVIARAQGNEWARWTEGVRYGLLGVDVVINPRVLVAQELAKIARSHGAIDVIDLAEDRLELVQLTLGESRLTNRPIQSLDLPGTTLVAAVVRDRTLFIPGGADVLLPGDRIYLIGQPDGVLRAEDMFQRKRQAQRVAILGGGVVGRAMARELARQGAQVLLVEKDRARAEALSAELASIEVIHGDGTDQTLLTEEEIGTYDMLAAVTGQDEVNLMGCLIARQAGVERTACIVQRADYVSIYRQLGIDIVLSPRTVASDHILRFTRSQELHGLTVLEDGQAEVVELTAAGGCRALGTPLHRLNLPRGALLAAIVRGEEVTIPHGDSVLISGDRVILVALREARPSIERIFRPRRL
jgi:trk system potassium uptake protein TrkA